MPWAASRVRPYNSRLSWVTTSYNSLPRRAPTMGTMREKCLKTGLIMTTRTATQTLKTIERKGQYCIVVGRNEQESVCPSPCS